MITLLALPETFSEWQVIERNTLGEFNISLLIDGYLPAAEAKIASSGWDGDRFVLFEHARNQDCHVTATIPPTKYGFQNGFFLDSGQRSLLRRDLCKKIRFRHLVDGR